MKYFIQTFGCQMNYSDSERIASVLEDFGYELATEASKADLLILNTCSVKQKAEDRVFGLRREMAEMKKQNPRLCIGMTGCIVRKTSTKNTGLAVDTGLAAENTGLAANKKRDPALSRMPELDITFKINEIARLPELIREFHPKPDAAPGARVKTPDESSLTNYFRIAPKKESKVQVLVPIMTGCDKFCTYCIVPFSRGREKSRDFDEILEECKKHVAEGALEITLIGQTVNSYGLSFNDKKSIEPTEPATSTTPIEPGKPTTHHEPGVPAKPGKFEKYGSSPFAALLREIDKLHANGLRRLRFTSPHPRDFSDELIKTLADLKTICPYIHMPVQAGDDNLLRRMNRNYRVDEYKEIMQKIRHAIPGCAISTDIIVGFCGETDEEFENTYRMYEEMEWDMCFLSRYSPRKGTYSEQKLADDVPFKTKAARWHRLNDLLNKIAAKKHAAFADKTVEVLVEQCEPNGNMNDNSNGTATHKCSGRTPEFKEVFFKSDRDLTGQLVPVKITKTDRFYLEGERRVSHKLSKSSPVESAAARASIASNLAKIV